MQRVALYEWALHNDPGLMAPDHWATHFVTHMASIWPKEQLGDPSVPGETIGLSQITVRKFLVDWKKKYHRDLRRPRELACEAILKTQLYAPSAAVRIMDYFKPAQNVLVNQGNECSCRSRRQSLPHRCASLATLCVAKLISKIMAEAPIH